MTPDSNPMDRELEQAVMEIHGEPVDDAVVAAAGVRVWARIVEAAWEAGVEAAPEAAAHIRSCADFQALIPDFRAGRLPEARAILVRDHLHQCVACRHVYEGKVTSIASRGSARPAPRRRAVYWAAAVVAAAGVSIWFSVDQFGVRSGRAYVQAVNGSLFEITAAGIRPLAVGAALPPGVEVRTAKDSDATLTLWDGSSVEMRERSALSSSRSGADLTIRVNRGAILVQAAKRRSGHLYVATDDCRVAVTGTVFSVNAGVKGSRVSVIQGEVHVSQDSQTTVLHPGQQSVSGPSLEPAPIAYDISWSRNGARLGSNVSAGKPVQASALLDRAPASTAVLALLPNAADAIENLRTSLRQAAEGNPQLRAWLSGAGSAAGDPLLARGPAGGGKLDEMFARLQAAGNYLNEVALVVFAGQDKQPRMAFLAHTSRAGLGDFLKKAGLPVAVEERPGIAVFGPAKESVEALAATLDQPPGGFQSSPCYQRLAEAETQGAGAVVCADLRRTGQPVQGASYFLGQDARVNGQPATRATLGFDGARTGMAAWLAEPAPMGSLDYITPQATLLLAFVVKDPSAIVDQTLALEQRSQAGADQTLAEASKQTGTDVRKDLAASLGGEFALALDGPVLPTPSWKFVAEVYDPAHLQATMRRVVDAFNAAAAKSGGKQWRALTETAEGRTYYTIGTADGNPLTTACYAFDDGYLVAAPSRAIVNQAIQARATRTSIARTGKFIAMMPRDEYANFSAVMYENLGTTLAPIAGLLGSLAPHGAGAGQSSPLQGLADAKPAFLAAYGGPDRVTIAGSGNTVGAGLAQVMSGSLVGIAGHAAPFVFSQGTRGPAPAFK
ncbi:MAG TPA: FecR domain-containing protein [Bryobacteraceae bacterium]|nr:FecR domain-containing protein [Bryobacteraceae bacterium]